MRFLRLLSAALLFLCEAAYCQTVNNTEQMVEKVISSGSIDGFTDKQLSRVGDAGAVALTKVVGGKNLSVAEIDSALTVIQLSFSAPQIVNVLPDREPRTTLFVLRYLDSCTGDPALKARIADTRKYVLEQFAKFTKN